MVLRTVLETADTRQSVSSVSVLMYTQYKSSLHFCTLLAEIVAANDLVAHTVVFAAFAVNVNAVCLADFALWHCDMHDLLAQAMHVLRESIIGLELISLLLDPLDGLGHHVFPCSGHEDGAHIGGAYVSANEAANGLGDDGALGWFHVARHDAGQGASIEGGVAWCHR